ncbi:hypothetical protein ACOMHN_052783 [Nucella lapillus]
MATALLQKQQSFQKHKDGGDDNSTTTTSTTTSTTKRSAPQPSISNSNKATSTAAPVTLGEVGRRTSSFLGVAGPKTASMSAQPQPTAPLPRSTGPTLFGLLASKRLAKRFASRFHRRRLGTMSSLMSSAAGLPPVVNMEPTYRMEPQRKFRPTQVEKMLKAVMDEKMSKFHYSARICANMCKVLGDDIKDKVKQMNFDRYKIVSNVVIGQKKEQAVMMCSRCAWDDKLDNFASYTFQNEHIFCTATVFGIYME